MVRFLGEALGPDTEVVLQDCNDFVHSIIAIANGHISGRTVGGPTTDLVLSIWQNREYEHKDYLTRYSGTTEDGRKLVSSTFFIRDAGGEVIGFLCINRDTSSQDAAQEALQDISAYFARNEAHADASTRTDPRETRNKSDSAADGPQDPAPETIPTESFAIKAEDLVLSRAKSFSAQHNLDLRHLNKTERLKLIEELEQFGVFMVRGSVETLAVCLGVSLPTVYRDLQSVRSQANAQHRG